MMMGNTTSSSGASSPSSTSSQEDQVKFTTPRLSQEASMLAMLPAGVLTTIVVLLDDVSHTALACTCQALYHLAASRPVWDILVRYYGKSSGNDALALNGIPPGVRLGVDYKTWRHFYMTQCGHLTWLSGANVSITTSSGHQWLQAGTGTWNQLLARTQLLPGNRYFMEWLPRQGSYSSLSCQFGIIHLPPSTSWQEHTSCPGRSDHCTWSINQRNSVQVRNSTREVWRDRNVSPASIDDSKSAAVAILVDLRSVLAGDRFIAFFAGQVPRRLVAVIKRVPEHGLRPVVALSGDCPVECRWQPKIDPSHYWNDIERMTADSYPSRQ